MSQAAMSMTASRPMAWIITAGAVVAASMMSAQSASARIPPTQFGPPVQFSTAVTTPEYQVARSFYGAKLPRDARLEAAKVVTANGQISIAVRIISQVTCGPPGCLTTVLESRNGRGWQEIFSRHSEQLEIGNLPRNNLENNGAALVRVNGREFWMMAPSGHYTALTDGLGLPVQWAANVNPDVLAVEPEASREGYADVGGPVGQLMLVTIGDCDTPVGCETKGVTGTGAVVFHGNAINGLISVNKEPGYQGVHNLLAAVSEGYDTYQWVGHGYRLVGTSYPSKMTTLP